MPRTRSNALTILDYLNEDCWRILLSYLDIDDIICSERVSKRWQIIVLAYLGSVRITIEGARHYESKQKDKYDTKCQYTLSQEHCSSFKSWTRKLGGSVVAIYCTNRKSWKIYRENCPNLESITFSNLEDQLPLSNGNEKFKCLQRLWFENCKWVSEQVVKQFLNNATLKELEIERNHTVTVPIDIILNITATTGIVSAGIGYPQHLWKQQQKEKKKLQSQRKPIISTSVGIERLKDINSKLKHLKLYYCQALQIPHLLSAVNSFSDLTLLHLIGVNEKVYEEIPEMLPKMPKLEHFHVQTTDYPDIETKCDDFVESVCTLSCLRHLNVNCRATDDHLDAITRCCKELHSLSLGICGDCVVTSRGVEAVCRNAGERLTSLCILASDHLTDNDVVTCVRSCPDLKYLNLRGCRALSERALSGARAARRARRPRARTLVFVSDILPSDHYENPFPYLRYEFGDSDLEEDCNMELS